MRYLRKKATINCIKIAFVSLFIILAINNIKLTISNNENLNTIKLLENSNKNLSLALLKTNDKVINLSSQLESAESAVLYQYGLNKALHETNNVLDKQIAKLKKNNKKLNKELDNSISRLSTYEKYKYVVFNELGKRTDVTYDQLKTGEEMMMKKGYDPDLLFSIVMVESTGRSDAYNKSSGASGYGQFMPATGKFVYEDLLKLGTYDHNTTPKNGDINIKMMARYIEYLYDRYDGDIIRGIKEYCGGNDSYTYRYIHDKIEANLPENETVYSMSLCKN